MSYIKGIKALLSRTVGLTCPHCFQQAEQSSAKVKKDQTLLCPHCGTLFLPSECRHIG